MNIKIDSIDISDIDLFDVRYKFTSKSYKSDIKKSVKVLGVVEPPIVLAQDDGYIIISGFHRIMVAIELDFKKIDCQVVDRVTGKLLESIAVKRLYATGLNSVSKLMVVNILNNIEKYSKDDLKKFMKSISIPLEYLDENKMKLVFNKIPSSMIDYIHSNDLNFKIIDKLVMFDMEFLTILNGYIEMINLKGNIFRSIVDLFVDFRKLDLLAKLRNLDNFDYDDGGRSLYLELYRLRYPRYSEQRTEMENLISQISSKFIKVDFPEYFEGGSYRLLFDISKKRGVDSFYDTIESLDRDKLNELLNLL